MTQIGALVAEAARTYGDAPALVAPDRTVTYADLDRDSDAVAAGLRARGVRPGSVVALTGPSDPDWVTAYLGTLKTGAAVCGVNPRLSDEQRRTALDLVVPDLVVDGEPPRAHGTPDRLDPDPERLVALVLTSGTTGEPKAAMFHERQFSAFGSIDTEVPPAGTPILASTEFAHIGITTKLPSHLRAGMRIHMLGRWRAAAALDVIERERLPMVGGIAAQIALLLRDPTFDERDLTAVRLVLAGGAPSPAALIEEARARFGASYSVRYSSTETGGLGTVAFDDDALVSVGRARAGVDVEVRDGAVWVRSPAMMSGYRNDPDATAEVMQDGWLRTGDRGRFDVEGRLVLTGRAKEFYIRGGYNVYPATVEAVLRDHPAVLDVAITPRADAVMGEVGVAIIVPRDRERAPSLEDLRVFARDRLAAHELPDGIAIVEELPLNSMHKLDRRALADLVRA